MHHSKMATLAVAAALALSAAPQLQAQSIQRIMEQDSTLDNLVDPPGYVTAAPGTLGGVLRAGKGSETMLIIPGLGFGGEIFREFIDEMSGRYRIVAVTLPGFAGTAAPPSPPEGTSFGDQTWTNSALAAIEKLIETEKMEQPIVIGHWLTGTQLALRLALRHPKKVRAVVLLAGAARMATRDTARARFIATPQARVASIDKFMAPRWFKTVTRETWDDNNFLPSDYAADPVRGLRLWRQAARPPLHVWVRYLNEFNAQDICPELERLTVPTLLLEPGFEANAHDPGNHYMELYCSYSWERCGRGIVTKKIPDARICLWYDQPKQVSDAIRAFLPQARAK